MVSRRSTLYGRTATARTLEKVADPMKLERQGLSLKFDDARFASKNKGNEMVRAQVSQILLTSPGERVMLPNFGVDIDSFLFEQITPDLLRQLKDEILEQIAEYASNLEVVSYQTKVSEASNGSNQLNIRLVVRQRDDDQEIAITITK